MEVLVNIIKDVTNNNSNLASGDNPMLFRNKTQAPRKEEICLRKNQQSKSSFTHPSSSTIKLFKSNTIKNYHQVWRILLLFLIALQTRQQQQKAATSIKQHRNINNNKRGKK